MSQGGDPMASYAYKNGLARVGRFWHYQFRWKGQKVQGSTGLEKKADAVAWLATFRQQIAMGQVGLAAAPTVEASWKAWKENRGKKVSPAHLDRAEKAWKHILPEVGHLRVDELTDEVVEKLLNTYLEGKSERQGGGARTAQGANLILAYLKIVVKPQLRVLPFHVKPIRVQEKVKAFVPPEKVKAFLAAVDRSGNLHQQVAIRAMLYMGLRESEALGMRWEWFQDDLATYTPGKTKGKEAIPLPVPVELRDLLRKLTTLSPWVLPADREKPEDPFVPHVAQFTVKAILRGGKAIKVEGLTPHRLRGTCATLMAKAGVSPFHIQQQLRHKDLKTTEKYVQVGLEDLVEAQKKTFGG